MRKEEAKTLSDLLQHHGWVILKRELELEIESIENTLLSIRGETGNKVEYTADDLLRQARHIYKGILEDPVDWIKQFK